jgi:hypothetical protein
MNPGMDFEATAPGDSTGKSPLSQVKSREEYAAHLRELREQAGSPTFRQLSKATNYSPSTLVDATSGRRLPTEAVVTALVKACGADPAPWVVALRGVAALEQARPPARGTVLEIPLPQPVAGDPASPRPPETPGARRLRRKGMLAALAGALVAFAVGLSAGAIIRAPASPSAAADSGLALPGVPQYTANPAPPPRPRGAAINDGTDPGAAHCTDARLLDKAPILHGSTQIGALELRYSARCGGGWARVYLYPGEPTMMGEATVRSGDDRLSAFINPLLGQWPVYTDIIVLSKGGCLAASGEVWQTGQPPSTATIPCQIP